MGALEYISAACKVIAESFGIAAEAFKELSKAMEAQNEAFQQMFVEPAREYVSELYETVASIFRSFYIPRDPIPKTPYKPSYKTVIFDKRLKFPKCRSNCR